MWNITGSKRGARIIAAAGMCAVAALGVTAITASAVPASAARASVSTVTVRSAGLIVEGPYATATVCAVVEGVHAAAGYDIVKDCYTDPITRDWFFWDATN